MNCTACGAAVPEHAAFCPACGAPARSAAAAAVTPAAVSAQGLRYAGFWRRFWAYAIDGFVIGSVTLPFGLFMGVPLFVSAVHDDFSLATIASLLGTSLMLACIRVAAWWLYFAIMESSSRQATLGKMALGLNVTDLAGRRISFARAAARSAAHLLSSMVFAIGFIMVAFTEKKQGLHDLVAGTLVTRGRPAA